MLLAAANPSCFSQTCPLLAAFGGPILVSKGPVDVVTDGSTMLMCSLPATPKRSGGQGDVLTGEQQAMNAMASCSQLLPFGMRCFVHDLQRAPVTYPTLFMRSCRCRRSVCKLGVQGRCGGSSARGGGACLGGCGLRCLQCDARRFPEGVRASGACNVGRARHRRPAHCLQALPAVVVLRIVFASGCIARIVSFAFSSPFLAICCALRLCKDVRGQDANDSRFFIRRAGQLGY